MTDTRFVYGANCTWYGSIHETGRTQPSRRPGFSDVSLPCCPKCGGMLYEMDNDKRWWDGVDKVDTKTPGYRKFVEWLRDNHFGNYREAMATYVKETGIDVSGAKKPEADA